ncbi:26S proteasome non-ATPase regulatory subunit 12-like [Clavelina lepadiformis]|uniref:26S proteasome non-ATPase regulatory subunit 12-like n=1 Tax=Clavelina lepadiformis TaxID=159417 RepID=UPI0040412F35
MSGDGKIEKMEIDYSDTVDRTIPDCEKLVQNGNLSEALEKLHSLEKQTRIACDMVSNGKVMVSAVRLCFDAKDWDTLNDNITVFVKKRSQLKQAIAKMVQECCTFVEKTPNLETKLKLINTLRTATEGKIYVEIERARLTRTLAKIKEDGGDISEAANILQELQVETFGSMERKEKIEFILEQMRLCLAKKDYIRVQIISKKISTRFFENVDEEVQKLKLRFYQMMIELDLAENSYLHTCKHFRAVYDTPLTQSDKMKWQQALKSVVLFVVLSPYDNEQSDMLARIQEEKKLEDIPKYKELLGCFVRQELIQLHKFLELYEHELREGEQGSPCTDAFLHTEEGEKRWKDFANRVVEHNIRVMAKYYTRITSKRMANLLNLCVEEAEEYLAKLVVNKTVFAKIDRLSGIISFARPREPSEVLNEWSNSLNKLMGSVNKATHLIAKEEMIHSLK